MNPVYYINTLVIDFRDVLAIGLDSDRIVVVFKGIGGYDFLIGKGETISSVKRARQIIKRFADWKLSEFVVPDTADRLRQIDMEAVRRQVLGAGIVDKAKGGR